MERRYYMLRSIPRDLTILHQMDSALAQIAQRHGLTFTYDRAQQDGDDLVRHIYLDPTGNSSLSLVSDLQVPARYLQIETRTSEEAQQLGQWLSESLPFIPLAELQQDARHGGEAAPYLLVRLALGAGQQAEAETTAILDNGLRSANDLMRFRAAQAMGLTSWPVFATQLADHSQTDPSLEVREMARLSLTACKPGPPMGRSDD